MIVAGILAWSAAGTLAAEGGGGHASAAAEGGHGEARTPFDNSSILNAIVTLIVFVVLVAVLGRYAWNPIVANLQRREEFIRQSLLQAKRDREEAEARLAEVRAQLEKARAEASAIVEEGRRDAEVLRRRLHEQARAEAQQMIQRAREEIRLARDSAVKEICDVAAELAVAAAARIIGREITVDDHERLIAESLEQMRERREGVPSEVRV